MISCEYDKFILQEFMKEYPEKQNFVEGNNPGFQTERFHLISFLAFFKDTVSQLWLVWVIQAT